MAIQLAGLAPLLQVFDMPASISFYRNVLGFTIEQPGPEAGDDVDWALLNFNGIQLMLNTAYEKADRPPVPEPKRSADYRDFTLYFGCPDVDGAYQHLLEKGLAVEPPVITHYGFKSLAVKDPDGFNLIFHWPAG